MTEEKSEKIINRLMAVGNEAYKKNFRKYCPTIARMLDRKETVEIEGQEYKCWYELVVVNMAKIIAEYCPDIEIEIELDGNNSELKAVISDKDEEVLNNVITRMVEYA